MGRSTCRYQHPQSPRTAALPFVQHFLCSACPCCSHLVYQTARSSCMVEKPLFAPFLRRNGKACEWVISQTTVSLIDHCWTATVPPSAPANLHRNCHLLIFQWGTFQAKMQSDHPWSCSCRSCVMQYRKNVDIHQKPLWKSSFSSTSSEGSGKKKLSLYHGKSSQLCFFMNWTLLPRGNLILGIWPQLLSNFTIIWQCDYIKHLLELPKAAQTCSRLPIWKSVITSDETLWYST